MNSPPGPLHSSRFASFAALVLLSSNPGEPLAAQLAPIGLSEVGAQWFENPTFSVNPAQPGELFGRSLAIGDFNNDGADDLATGIPMDDGYYESPCDACGAVVVRFGEPGLGLPSSGPGILLSPQDPAAFDPAEPFDLFGFALAAGDFNGDGHDDLAVGVPGNRTDLPGAGGVSIHYGLDSAQGGIQAGGELFLRQGAFDTPGEADLFQRFGWALAAGDFNADGYADLAVAAPFDDDCGQFGCGTVTVFHGTSSGLFPWFAQILHQGSDFIVDDPEAEDLFGAALAAGDFDGNGADDLVIGVAGEDEDSGAVQVIFGSEWGLLFVANGIWREFEFGDPSELSDSMGASLAVGNFDGDAYEDLAVGVPGEDLGDSEDAGLFILMYGGPEWFDIPRTQLWTQNTIDPGPESDGPDDRFGSELASGDFDGDGIGDLAVSHPGEALDVGAVTILMGAAGTGLTQRVRTILPGLSGIPGPSAQPALMGSALAGGDFAGDGFDDLAIGLPNYSSDGAASHDGATIVLYGALFADGFELGTPGRWSADQP